MKRTFYLLAMAGLLCAASSCSNGSDVPNVLADADPIVLKSEYSAKTTDKRSFALDFFKTTVAASGGENIFVAPYSVNAALNMLWNGAAGDTETEMREILGNGVYTKAQINDYSKTLTDALLAVDPTTDLRIANSIWADNTTPFKSTFIHTNKTGHNAEIRNVDFSQSSTFDEIDRWCREKTNNKIDKITDGMTSDTKFALINAIYFKAKWVHKFSKSETRTETFTNSDGSKSQVQMMNQKEDLYYSDDDKEWKLLILPYGNKAFSMVILMPYADQQLDDAMATLTADQYYDLLNSANRYSVTVKLPKFKAEYSYKLHEEILPAMGMKEVFSASDADLSEMSDTRMFVNMVMHKTYIDVYEEGTEAAAATSVSGIVTSPGPGTPINFFVNAPFIYSIVENSTGTILLMGRMNKF